ncbi:hypothetical protein TRFO_32807 [Tritrichomonas foetus]|uniref:Uncharacterized protein n=1 Tax=Tritrichomonas foetus TaxID=1144522 RepID=A0A1J4JSJ4_9EUKA|nr:hypothetical protein TRFO_32807 [Tritrichomonas foetus]|eukprot:OHT00492.1 hypothetical protein TRFO_32807 [Tritrichomonas foetus]
MLLFFFLNLISSMANMQIRDFIIGEWDVIEAEPEKIKQQGLKPTYSVEFHPNPVTGFIDGSIWNDTINSTDVLGIEDFEVAQLEIEFLTDFNGRIFSLQPKREFMTDFTFQPANMGLSLVTKGKINKNYSFQLSLTNGTFFQMYITSSLSSKVDNLYIVRTAKIATPSTGNKYKILLYIGLIIVLIQIILWIALKCCRSSLDKKISMVQENTVIDLDKYGEYLKQQNSSKSKQD